MSRIRCLKPEIIDDELLGACALGAQLLFDRLITQADDHGRCRGTPAWLRCRIFPYRPEVTDADVEGWLGELAAAGLLSQYRVRGQGYVVLTSWAKHQRLDNAGAPVHPGPDEADPPTVPDEPEMAIRREPPRLAASRREPPRTAAGEDQDQDLDQPPPYSPPPTSDAIGERLEALREAWNANCHPLPVIRVALSKSARRRSLWLGCWDACGGDMAWLGRAVARFALDEHNRVNGYDLDTLARHPRWLNLTADGDGRPPPPEANGARAENEIDRDIREMRARRLNGAGHGPVVVDMAAWR